MLAQLGLDDRYLDRPGCGDELYLDACSKLASWLADSILGAAPATGLELDFVDDEPYDA